VRQRRKGIDEKKEEIGDQGRKDSGKKSFLPDYCKIQTKEERTVTG
jgi:hypothetical protein